MSKVVGDWVTRVALDLGVTTDELVVVDDFRSQSVKDNGCQRGNNSAVLVNFQTFGKQYAVVRVEPIKQDNQEQCYEVIRLRLDHKAGVGGMLWALALALPRVVIQREGDLRGKQVLVLGAGLGTEGVMLASRGAQVLLTDLPEVLPTMEYTVKSNQSMVQNYGGFLTSSSLPWGPSSLEECRNVLRMDFDIVLGCEIVYNEDALPDLLWTLRQVVRKKTVLYLALEDRYFSCLQFVRELGLSNQFLVENVQDFDTFGAEDPYIFSIRSRISQ
uniref:Calmodulin-lysine N-methyltransferase n=1 Tax=Timspurckia oligopyrenoides TaxID=708627 RepID=A0A7S0ZFY2_9RHOD|mmetsp:Transcript_3644/g.6379  ORF Transcript_3644/g.6379 Transcript_3644/m.6379 type:complete len:273 (+) Transcript_3644:86-904(+)